MKSPDRLSRTFRALSDPTRRAIVTRLSRGETSVTELARPFKISLPAVSRHLKVLAGAGLIVRGRRAQWRPCRLDSSTIAEAVRWMDQCRKEWEARLDRLAAFLEKTQKEEARKSRS